MLFETLHMLQLRAPLVQKDLGGAYCQRVQRSQKWAEFVGEFSEKIFGGRGPPSTFRLERFAVAGAIVPCLLLILTGGLESTSLLSLAAQFTATHEYMGVRRKLFGQHKHIFSVLVIAAVALSTSLYYNSALWSIIATVTRQ
eukprot:Gregarina_sp_Poly_1__10631@NODE_799_length_6254_cov_58_006627_g584_i0_p6_GENE_NODE_799_length_6254_cov_58_006627_g584_i0NODE_799_length_6254_cov_58_006627_g584_i0_p6_ORF_typecomplete_len142_score0_24CTP_transf_1/PF01148_20/0_06DUF1056/PF06341_11/2_9e02DUF1056/PF06341_11/0_48_NODE_799_length_6254_cov_58_006627_g584_i055125937